MKIPKPKINPVVAGSLSLLVWIVLLAVHFRTLLGAEITREWLIAGTIFSIGAFFLVLLLHEASELFGESSAACRKLPAPTRVGAGSAACGISTAGLGADRIDWGFVEQHRSDLGLRGRTEGANRFR